MLADRFFDKEPHEMATFGFQARGLVSEIQSKVVEMAKVWSVSAFPSNCTAGLEEELEENKPTTFIVTLKDFKKNEPFKDCEFDVCDMKAIVKDPKGGLFPNLIEYLEVLFKHIGFSISITNTIITNTTDPEVYYYTSGTLNGLHGTIGTVN
jgi:hypothetical protein